MLSRSLPSRRLLLFSVRHCTSSPPSPSPSPSATARLSALSSRYSAYRWPVASVARVPVLPSSLRSAAGSGSGAGSPLSALRSLSQLVRALRLRVLLRLLSTALVAAALVAALAAVRALYESTEAPHVDLFVWLGWMSDPRALQRAQEASLRVDDGSVASGHVELVAALTYLLSDGELNSALNRFALLRQRFGDKAMVDPRSLQVKARYVIDEHGVKRISAATARFLWFSPQAGAAEASIVFDVKQVPRSSAPDAPLDCHMRVAAVTIDLGEPRVTRLRVEEAFGPRHVWEAARVVAEQKLFVSTLMEHQGAAMELLERQHKAMRDKELQDHLGI